MVVQTGFCSKHKEQSATPIRLQLGMHFVHLQATISTCTSTINVPDMQAAHYTKGSLYKKKSLVHRKYSSLETNEDLRKTNKQKPKPKPSKLQCVLHIAKEHKICLQAILLPCTHHKFWKILIWREMEEKM